MLALADARQAVATIVVFIATFFLTLSIGRLLKRRAGVRFGLFFQLFALVLAFYAGSWVYGLDLRYRNHTAAVLTLMGTVVFISLLDRYLWDLYFEQRRHTVIPKFLRSLVAWTLCLIMLFVVLSAGYHAERELKGLLFTSSFLAVVLAFAVQNVLGGVVAGMSLQLSKPYKVGDWLQVGERFAEVMEINWRATRLRTNDGIYLDIPNNEIVRQTIINLHYPQQLHAMRIVIGVDYNTPPTKVKDALMQATLHAEGVQKDPAPKIFLKDFADFAIHYEIKFWMLNHQAYNDVCDAIRTNAWYEFKRQKITIPFPIRTLELRRRPAAKPEEEQTKARTILASEPLFSCLTNEQLDHLVSRSRSVRFGRGEKIIEQGADGTSMFVLLHGAAHVSVSQNGTLIRVGALRMGDCFGEMSLLTGERRTATVRAEDDCEVLEIAKPTMAAVLRESPECVTQLSDLLAARKMETEGLIKDATRMDANDAKAREYRAGFLRRLRAVFEL
jgi:small-conductance mechanosensitive channel/CRP-like cAMP-binding protein